MMGAGRRVRTFHASFAGGGTARAALGPGWSRLLADDVDPRKAASHAANRGGDGLQVGDAEALPVEDLPGTASVGVVSL